MADVIQVIDASVLAMIGDMDTQKKQLDSDKSDMDSQDKAVLGGWEGVNTETWTRIQREFGTAWVEFNQAFQELIRVTGSSQQDFKAAQKALADGMETI